MPKTITYGSTRGHAPRLSFDDVLLTGLANDGGLYTPDHWPQLDLHEQANLHGADYGDIAEKVIGKFVPDSAGHRPLREMIDDAYGRFSHPAVTPLIQVGPDDFILELFHGPTLAFKDVAMQLLGHLFADRLTAAGRTMTIVAATSGDTGAAAIDAMAGRGGIGMCVLHPAGRISEVQRRFMTTNSASNVMNIAVEGTFDDCQALVKAMFADQSFRQDIHLGAVNSINWARIVAQTVYYFSASLMLSRSGTPVSFCVPTGNFGDVFAGYVAKRMGAPIGRLIVATNENDILNRAIRTGAYRPDKVVATQSPSMDIQVSSNFERLLFLATGRDAQRTSGLMAGLASGEGFSLDEDIRAEIARDFSSYRATEVQTQTMMRFMAERAGQCVDPHTAVGLVAAKLAREDGQVTGPLVTLSTAHPAKFPDAVEQATGTRPQLPLRCDDLFNLPEQLASAPNDLAVISDMVRARFASS